MTKDLSGNEEICLWLEQWFARRGKIAATQGSGKPVSDLRDRNYFDAGWLSSLEVIEFVTEIEGYFGVQFSDADFQDSRLVTISGLSELIEERIANGSTQAAGERAV